MVNIFNEENFESEVVNSEKTTIVDFYTARVRSSKN